LDEFFKANINRDHRYYIDFRDSRADTIFRDWRNDYFVAYLRRVFKWGGFPEFLRQSIHKLAPHFSLQKSAGIQNE
jgi:hypothetical protein